MTDIMKDITPLPWRAREHAESRGKKTGIFTYTTNVNIGYCQSMWGRSHVHFDFDEPNAAFIVRAANSYQPMLEALEAVKDYYEGNGKYNFSSLSAIDRANEANDAWYSIYDALKEAIALAKGETQ